ncbi:DNA gyrase inhibitor YacG [Allorhodopirellula solitaria]|uniref:DNA gyrase inhibitor YacG n=1 Tax=Allorhodopirellula solitaria TaxID=2527987 RepID=A0A5C5X1V9_9BACT|nr:DNA gyrase inhibitor YacG [Allorhodopirellula solitaria]TWT56222.1 DNA gyrase inhibitor YacG [Allorhodopirellula solitaria]
MKPNPMTCPTCGRKFLSDETPTPPFCTSRCQLIDLGRWFNEEIGVPFEGDAEDTPVEYRDYPDEPPRR